MLHTQTSVLLQRDTDNHRYPAHQQRTATPCGLIGCYRACLNLLARDLRVLVAQRIGGPHEPGCCQVREYRESDLKRSWGATDIPGRDFRTTGWKPVPHVREPVCPERVRMYADFFGFRELPFNNTPDPRFFYSTPDHEEALASLIYAVKERKGFVLLTGETGTGKTLVSRMMLRHFGTQVAFATINHAVSSAGDLVESICTEFELSAKRGASLTQLVRTLQDFLLAQFTQNIPVVLLLDEAQNLPAEGFEQLRMIGNLEADDAKLLQIAIVGQPELQHLFLSPELRQIRQRIFRSFHLPALGREATEGYIQHRLSVVTDTPVDIFSADAVAAIYKFSRGLPRVINAVCDNALLSAYSADRHDIDAPFAESVIAQMMIIDPQQGEEEETDPAAPRTGAEPFAPGTRTSSYRRSGRRVGDGLGDARASYVPVRLPPIPATRQDGCPDQQSAGMDGAPAAEWVQRVADTLAHRIEELTHQVQNMETRLRERPPIIHVNDRPEPPRDTGYGGEIRSKFDGVFLRLAALERRLKGKARGWAETRATVADLKPLVQQAHSTAGRVETASQELGRREEQLRKLAGTVKDIIRDLRKLLDRAHEASAKTRHAERSARAACDRLAAQSQSSRRLADELAQIADRGVSRNAADGVQQMFDDARENLSDLHSLARGNRNTSTEPDVANEQSPTARLAHQVENLLEMTGPRA
ncbi:MAG: AAA family ATPase [Phycisphaerae bacterium]